MTPRTTCGGPRHPSGWAPGAGQRGGTCWRARDEARKRKNAQERGPNRRVRPISDRRDSAECVCAHAFGPGPDAGARRGLPAWFPRNLGHSGWLFLLLQSSVGVGGRAAVRRAGRRPLHRRRVRRSPFFFSSLPPTKPGRLSPFSLHARAPPTPSLLHPTPNTPACTVTNWRRRAPFHPPMSTPSLR